MNEQISPKGSQTEAKRDKKSKQRLQDDLGPPWGRFPGYPLKTQDQLGAQNQPKIKQTTWKTNVFLLGFSIRKWSEKGSQNQLKLRPTWSKIDSRSELKEKTGENRKRTQEREKERKEKRQIARAPSKRLCLSDYESQLWQYYYQNQQYRQSQYLVLVISLLISPNSGTQKLVQLYN